MFHLSLSESQNGSGSSLIGFRRSLCLIEELESVIGYDLLLGSIAAFYVFMVPYTKVEESFNVQYDHLEFPGVVPRTFIGAILVSILASPVVSVMSLLHLPKIYSLFAVNLAYGNWLKGHFYAALNCLVCIPHIFATLIFRCDILLLLCPLGLELLLTKSITLWKALKCCIGTALFCIGLTVLVDTIMWKKFVWPEFQVLWFNSVLNRSSEWGLGVILDRRVVFYILPVVSYVLLYSKLPHKELRFVISSVPMFNLSAAIAASRIYNNRKKSFWKLLHIILLGLLMVSLGCTIITFMASCENYPSGYALKDLHKKDNLHMRYSKASKESRLQSEKLVYPHVGSLTNNSTERWVHIDPFSAMNGISRFCEDKFPWRYCKEEGIPIQEFNQTNFTYLLNEHSNIHGFKCLFAVSGFSRVRLQIGIPPISLLKEPKVFIHGNIRSKDVMNRNWPGCS
ncbi:hypothetical protein RHGRI_019344 [Rhododendron griersonianum]|uniref:Mannosyltransferase n=1 Tax=Rhododendron griersonianum TaxID=479676 RepID=A0AAV6JC42_9ERIC|nr:hypothetical protein RHGRI_019344 [Rhododendron griersonianum]